MTSEAPGKSFDCVAYMREARTRISDRMMSMSRDEFRNWLRSYRHADPALAKLAAETREAGTPQPMQDS